jgi:hypothetical protein
MWMILSLIWAFFFGEPYRLKINGARLQDNYVQIRYELCGKEYFYFAENPADDVDLESLMPPFLLDEEYLRANPPLKTTRLVGEYDPNSEWEQLLGPYGDMRFVFARNLGWLMLCDVITLHVEWDFLLYRRPSGRTKIVSIYPDTITLFDLYQKLKD